MQRTFYFPVYTTSLVFSDVLNGEQFKAAALPVNASVLLSSGDVFQSHIPDLWKLGSACRTTLDTLCALAADVMAVRTQLYGWHHVLHAHRTLQVSQQIFVESTWQIFHISGVTPVPHCTGGCVDPRSGHDILEKEKNYCPYRHLVSKPSSS